MNTYPSTIAEYEQFGEFLAYVLDIPVLKLCAGDKKEFGAGWAYLGAPDFGVMNGNFSSAGDAYSDLACRCMDACSGAGGRYDKFLNADGRAIIQSALWAVHAIAVCAAAPASSLSPVLAKRSDVLLKITQ